MQANQALQAVQAVQALQHLDPAAEAEIEPLTQDPTLLVKSRAQMGLTDTIHIQLPPHPGDPHAGPYTAELAAAPDIARTIQVWPISLKSLIAIF